MNRDQLVHLINSLDLPKEEYYILSSGCLLIYGLRDQVNNLDLCVSQELFEEMIKKFNIDISTKNDCGFYKLNGFVEVVVNNKKDFKRQFKGGYPVESLRTILDFKLKRNALKDQSDIRAIRDYLKTSK